MNVSKRTFGMGDWDNPDHPLKLAVMIALLLLVPWLLLAMPEAKSTVLDEEGDFTPFKKGSYMVAHDRVLDLSQVGPCTFHSTIYQVANGVATEMWADFQTELSVGNQSVIWVSGGIDGEGAIIVKCLQAMGVENFLIHKLPEGFEEYHLRGRDK
jgi:hypothetical protein